MRRLLCTSIVWLLVATTPSDGLRLSQRSTGIQTEEQPPIASLEVAAAANRRLRSSWQTPRVVNADVAEEATAVAKECQLEAGVKEMYYNTETQVWIVDDELLEKISMKLHLIVNCTVDGDVLMFKTTETVKPKKKMEIKKRLTITGEIADPSSATPDAFPKADNKVAFTCPSATDGIFLIKGVAVTFANIVIRNCDMKIGSPVSVESCPVEKERSTVNFVHVNFLKNAHPHGAVAVHAMAPSCADLSFEHVKIKENVCEASTVAVIEGDAGTHAIARSVSASENACTVFIANGSRLDISGSEFFQNLGVISGDKQDARGGAVRYVGGSEGQIVNCTFKQNDALYGGSVCMNDSSKVSAKNSVFKSSAATDGGAFYVLASALFLENCTLAKNTAADDGGAIYLNDSSVLEGKDLTFLENKASHGGGAIFERKSDISLKNATFESNVCHGTDGGGAVFTMSESTLKGEILTFKKNVASRGGGLYIADGTGELSDSLFRGNSADNNGGGLFLSAANLNGTKLRFESNKATNDGGGFVVRGEVTIRLDDVAFSENSAQDGGAGYLDSGSVLIGEKLSFIHNKGVSGGGGLYFGRNGRGNILRSYFERNIADNGGAIAVMECAAPTQIRDTQFVSNMGNMAGAILAQQSDVNLSNVSFRSNSVSGLSYSCGGAIMLNVRSKMTCDQANFRENHAAMGGALCVGPDCSATVRESTFSGNGGGSNGGAMYASAAILDFEDSIAQNNSAAIGGAFDLSSVKGYFIRMAFAGNHADRDGGAIHADQSSLEIEYSTFAESSAARGAALFSSSAVSENLLNVSFVGNVAEEAGGALFAAGGSDRGYQDLELTQNTAKRGAGLYMENTPAALNGAIFLGNEATELGGGIYVSSAKLDGNNLTVEDNSADDAGGGMYVAGPKLVALRSSDFARNAANSGGAIFATDADLRATAVAVKDNSAIQGGGVFAEASAATLENVTISMNVASKKGGACLVKEGSLTATDVVVWENTAERGAGLHVGQCPEVTIQKGRFVRNVAELDGGAIFEEAVEKLAITDVELAENEGARGGAIYIFEGEEVHILRSTLVSNRATQNGAGLYVERSTLLNIEDTHLEGNEASYGGGCYIQETETTLTRTSFQSNVAGKHGGAVAAANVRHFTGEGLNLVGNEALFGGGLYFQESEANLNGSIFSRNSAGDAGGAINSLMGTSITGTFLHFEQNNATYGGAVDASETTLRLSDSEFLSNEAQYEGGAFVATSESVVHGSFLRLDRNRAANGGAVKVQYRSDLSLSDTLMIGNEAQQRGGALLVEFSEHIKIQDSRVEKNMAYDKGGGAFFRDVENALLYGDTFSENRAAVGAALYGAPGTHLDVGDCSLERNSAIEEGGAMRLEEAELHCRTTTFYENVAGANGGALYMDGASKLKCQSSVFKENAASGSGGGISILSKGRSVDCEIEDVSFVQNHAAFGGAMHFERTREQARSCGRSFAGVCHGVEIWNTAFENNQATFSGAIALLTDPYGFHFSCDTRAETVEMLNLEPLADDSDDSFRRKDFLCPSWTGNVVPDVELRTEEFGSRAQDVEVLPVTETYINGPRIYRNGENLTLNARIDLPLPTIDVVSVDAFRNELQPTAEDEFWSKIVAPEGFLKRGTEIGIQNIDGQEMFADISIAAPPGEYELQLQYGNSILNGSVPLYVEVAGCPEGQSLGSDGRCSGCGPHEFERNGACLACPPGEVCHGHFSVAGEGRWHTNPCFTKTQRCLVEEACDWTGRPEELLSFAEGLPSCNLSESQLEEYGNLQCDEGYASVLCGSCEEGYGPLSKWKCVDCPKRLWSVVLLVSMTLWTGLLAYTQIVRHQLTHPEELEAEENRIALLSNGSATTPPRLPIVMPSSSSEPYGNGHGGVLEDGQGMKSFGHHANGSGAFQDEGTGLHWTRLHGSISASRRAAVSDVIAIEVNRTSEFLKVLINYVQLLSVFAALNINWPSGVRRTMEIGETIGGVATLVTSFVSDCILSPEWSVAKPVLRLITGVCMPLAVSAVIVFGWVAWKQLTRQGTGYFCRFCLLTLSTVSYVSYLGVTKLAVRMLYCISVDVSVDDAFEKEIHVLADDTSVECWEGVHWTLAGIASAVLVLFTVGFPLLSLLRIKRREACGGRNCASVGVSLGFMYWPYQRKFCLWEFFIFFRKAVLATLCVFSHSTGENQQQTAAAVLMIGLLYLQVICCPYDEHFRDLNSYEASSIFLSIAMLSLGMIFDDDDPSDHARAIASWMLYGLNCAFFLAFLYRILGSLRVLRATKTRSV